MPDRIREGGGGFRRSPANLCRDALFLSAPQIWIFLDFDHVIVGLGPLKANTGQPSVF